MKKYRIKKKAHYNTYEIDSLERLINVANEENFERLIVDFSFWLAYTINLAEKMRKSNPEKHKDKLTTEMFDSKFIWTDDGVSGVTSVKLTNKSTGQVQLHKIKKQIP